MLSRLQILSDSDYLDQRFAFICDPLIQQYSEAI